MSRGTTLLELLLVLSVLALLTLIATPKVGAIAADLALRQEAAALVRALDEARLLAMQRSDVTSLTLTGSSYRVERDSQLLWQQSGPLTRGITLSGAGAPIQFGASGVTLGVANRTFVLTRAGRTRRVVISRLGRITP